MELASLWIGGALVLAALVVLARARASRLGRASIAVAMIASGAAFARGAKHETARGPRVDHASVWVGSGACKACHPSEHASWSRTYHRTMTQRGTGEIAITTGSHHMQGFWTEDDEGALHMLPIVFAWDEHRFISRADAFLEPPDAPQHDVRWNSNCIACHVTGGEPRLEERGVKPEVAELGIACEACHGPGAEHAALERNPFTRWSRPRDLHIVNPARLSPERASAVCGSCHAYAFPRDERAFLRSGYAESFRPGDALEPSRILLTPDVLARREVALDTDAQNLFWPDGTVRVGGREYSAMILSACWLRGAGERKITCMSCHAMHRSDPDDQLRTDRSVQDACISCHKMPANHSKHQEGSAGSRCVACHMPKTSYALRSAIRSHRIDSPTSFARPSACNLCHLDKPASWTRASLARLWSVSVSVPVPDSVSVPVSDPVPASVSGLLMADAAERVIWADAFGDDDARATSGADWEAPVLEIAQHDPYAVIRFIAERSASKYGPAARELVTRVAMDSLVSHRDNRDVHVAE